MIRCRLVIALGLFALIVGQELASCPGAYAAAAQPTTTEAQPAPTAQTPGTSALSERVSRVERRLEGMEGASREHSSGNWWELVALLATVAASIAAWRSAGAAARSASLTGAQRKAYIAPMVVLRSDFEKPKFKEPDEGRDRDAKVALVNAGNGIALNVRASYEDAQGSKGKEELASAIAIGESHFLTQDHEWWKAFRKREAAVVRVVINYTDAEGNPYRSIRNEHWHWKRRVPEHGDMP